MAARFWTLGQFILLISLSGLAQAYAATPKDSYPSVKSLKNAGKALDAHKHFNSSALFSKLFPIYRDYFLGLISLADRNEKVDLTLSQFEMSRSDTFFLMIDQLLTSREVLKIALSNNQQHELKPFELQTLVDLGIDPNEAGFYLDILSSQFQSYIDAIKSHGIKLSSEMTLDFSHASLSVGDLQKNPDLGLALSIFGSELLTLQLSDPERKSAVVTDTTVFLPVLNEKLDQPIKTLSPEAYQKQIDHWTQELKNAREEFVRAAIDASQYTNFMSGLWEYVRLGERGLNGQTKPEIDLARAFERMLQIVDHLEKKLGADQEYIFLCRKVMMEALKLNAKLLDQGMQKIDAAWTATIAAPIVPVIIYAAPAAGGLIGLSETVSTTTEFIAAVQLTVALAAPIVLGTADTLSRGGSLTQNIFEGFADVSAPMLGKLPFSIAIPSGLALIGAAAAEATVSWVAIPTYGALNLTAALRGVGLLVKSGVAGAEKCYQGLKTFSDQAKGTDSPAESALYTQYIEKTCLTSGIDLSFAFLTGFSLVKDSVQAMNKVEAKTAFKVRLQNGVKTLIEGQVKPKKTDPKDFASKFLTVLIRAKRLYTGIQPPALDDGDESKKPH